MKKKKDKNKAIKHEIISDFGDAEVRRKTQQNVPSIFREWESVPSEVGLLAPEWGKISRFPNHLGYPPFDIYSNWIMDFATITANLLDVSSWKDFRRMLLIHVPDCPFYCWYCFNDAWGDERYGKCKTGQFTADHIIKEFKKCRADSQSYKDAQINVLRISGGEPFLCPDLISDLADKFRIELDGENAFLWVDTNLYPLHDGISDPHRNAIQKLKALGKKSAIHACLHAINEESYYRNTTIRVSTTRMVNALASLVEAGLNVYPRINPIALTSDETQNIFCALWNINKNLPLKTYLGPVELKYDHAIDRMLCFQRKTDGLITDNPKPRRGRSRNIKPPEFQPTNVSIYTWNQLLELNYDVGYAKVPRHVDFSEAYIQRKEKCILPDEDASSWKNIFTIFKGWQKDIYALKMLEALAVPNGAIVEIEFENSWVESNLLAHAYTSPEYYLEKNVDVLILAAYEDKTNVNRGPQFIPVRWGNIEHIHVSDCRNKNHSLKISIRMREFANDLRALLDGENDSNIYNLLAKYTGGSRLPYATDTSHFCQFFGLKLKELSNQKKSHMNKIGFQSVAIELSKTTNEMAKLDLYYTINDIKINGENLDYLSQGGKIVVKEGDEVELSIESCNRKMGSSGYPSIDRSGLEIQSTDEEKVKINPSSIFLSKYGKEVIKVSFARSGTYSGYIIFQAMDRSLHSASFRIPYEVELKEG